MTYRADMKPMSKYSEEYLCFNADTKKTKQREITPKVGKPELSFLYMTRRLVLFYISTKYHQNILKSIQVTEQTPNLYQTKQREITLKVRKPELSSCRRHVILSCSTFLPSIIKIFQRVFKLQSGKVLGIRWRWCRWQRDPSQKQYVPPPFGRRGHK